jgi:hypothetical protein
MARPTAKIKLMRRKISADLLTVRATNFIARSTAVAWKGRESAMALWIAAITATKLIVSLQNRQYHALKMNVLMEPASTSRNDATADAIAPAARTRTDVPVARTNSDAMTDNALLQISNATVATTVETAQTKPIAPPVALENSNAQQESASPKIENAINVSTAEMEVTREIATTLHHIPSKFGST